MQEFIREYGHAVIAVIIGVLLSTVLYTVFLVQWEHKGIAADGKKTDFSRNALKKSPPTLSFKNIKVEVGEKVELEKQVKALDSDGTDISNDINWTEISGSRMKRVGDTISIDTSNTGVERIELSVKSRISEKIVKREMVILIDYRI